MADAPTDEERSGIDPDIFWVLGEGKPYYFLPGRQPKGQEWMPLLLRLSEGVTAQDFANGRHIRAEDKRVAWRSAVRVSSLYTDSSIGAGDGPYLTAMMRASYLLEDFTRDPDLRADVRRAVVSVTPGRPLDSSSLPPPEGTPAAAPAPVGEQDEGRRTLEARAASIAAATASSNMVVMGIIDDGIAFAHDRFRKVVGGAVESRVENWWLQDGPFRPPYPPFTLPPPQNVLFGCELSRSQINFTLQQSTSGGLIDDDVFYRKVRLVDFQTFGHKSAAWRIAHGTHVMDLACGFDPLPPRDDRPIIAVQLPIRVTADTSGAQLFPFVVEGIVYILDRASKIPGAANAPVVVNLSYGRYAGPHDGTADLELAIEALIALSGGRLHVVLPAGNNYLARTHAQITFNSLNEVKELGWRILPDDQTPSFAEIWLPKRGPGPFANRIEVTITSPTGESHKIVEGSPPVSWGAPVHAQAFYFFSLLTGRSMFRIYTKATTDLNPAAPLAPAGTWTISLKNIALTGETVHAWVQRDDSLYGFPLRGRQSYFDDPDYVRFDNAGRDKETDDPGVAVRRESTINAIATGRSPIVMGGYLGKERLPAKYSAAGIAPVQPPPPPPPDLTPRWPDAMTVSEDSRVHTGVLAAGSHSGSVVAMGGTSVAAPQIARRIADDLAGGGAGDRAKVQALGAAGIPLPQPERSGTGGIPSVPIVRLNRYEFP